MAEAREAVTFTFGMSSSPSVTVTVKCVWVKNSSSIQSGWSSWTKVNLSGESTEVRHQVFLGPSALRGGFEQKFLAYFLTLGPFLEAKLLISSNVLPAQTSQTSSRGQCSKILDAPSVNLLDSWI